MGVTSSSVLVVDDEPSVRRWVRRQLERAGMRVFEAEDGCLAMQALERERGAIGVVVMDLDMPELDGERAFAALRELDPGLPVVILSGLCDEPCRRRLELAGARAVLEKPCEPALLRSTVHAALAARAR
jgi:two-component system cell cycle sensor histidine kinase/response regulator CckA